MFVFIILSQTYTFAQTYLGFKFVWNKMSFFTEYCIQLI